MPWNLKNVATDPLRAMGRRMSSKLEMEPVIGGRRIRLRQSITISDKQYEINKTRIERLVKGGVLEAYQEGGPKKKVDQDPEPKVSKSDSESVEKPEATEPAPEPPKQEKPAVPAPPAPPVAPQVPPMPDVAPAAPGPVAPSQSDEEGSEEGGPRRRKGKKNRK